MLIKGKTKWSCFPGAPCGSLSISEAIICPGQPPPHCCPDGCQLPRCLHGLCSLAASRTQMHCSVFVNRLKIPWCCSSEGPGVQRGWEGSWGQAASGEQASHGGTEPRDGSLRRCTSGGWLERDTAHRPQHGCPAALALLSQRCQASSDQCSWCASVRDVTCNAPGRLCSPSEEEFLSFLYNNCMCWVWWCRACRVLASPGTASLVSWGDTVCWAPSLRVPWVRLVSLYPLGKEVRKACSFRHPISEGIRS